MYDLFVPPGMKGLSVIYPRLFQHGHFETPVVLHIFSTLSVKYKASKFSPECYVTKSSTITFQCKRNYVLLINLQISFQGGTRAASTV